MHCIIVISNPCSYACRFILAKEFIKKFEFEENVILYIVELAYGDQKYYITETIRLEWNQVLWHKKNMINIGVQKLLPPKWKAFAWIDAVLLGLWILSKY